MESYIAAIIQGSMTNRTHGTIRYSSQTDSDWRDSWNIIIFHLV